MIKYITNHNRYIRVADRTIFFMTKAIATSFEGDSHIKLYKSKDGNYIKVKACDPKDLNGNKLRITRRDNTALFSAVELVESTGIDKVYAYGTDTHGGIIFRINETNKKPKDFKVIKKETKMFLATANNSEIRCDLRLSAELYRRLNKPKCVKLHVDEKRKRLYIARANKRMGTYPVTFIKTSPNSGFARFSALGLIDKFNVTMGDFLKREVKIDNSGKYYLELNGVNLPTNSRGQHNAGKR